MTREREIELLMLDRCTKSEAEKHLKNGSTIFEDFEKILKVISMNGILKRKIRMNIVKW